jgi:hypothetical protein
VVVPAWGNGEVLEGRDSSWHAEAVTRTLALPVLALFLVAAPPASAAVTKTMFTASVAAGDDATLTVRVAPKARCTITVVYKTGASKAKGLSAKTGAAITWKWRVGSNTTPGRWPVTVDCGKSGKLALRLAVRAG